MIISHQGKIALVGGATNGLGRAVALQLASSGASIILVSRNEENLKAVCKELPQHDHQHHSYLNIDYSNFEDYKHKISAFLENKTIDILVNNSQGPDFGNVLQKNTSDYQESFDLLFKTVVFTTNLILPKMQDKGWGRIINISSVAIKEPIPHLVLSNAIRLAVAGWAKSLATELAPQNISVNSILTGYFGTSRLLNIIENNAKIKGVSPDLLIKEVFSHIPMQRFGKPEEYGYLVNFLASEYSNYITGTSIPIDGGLLKGCF